VQPFRDRLSPALGLHAMFDQLVEIVPPFSKVVVDIDHGHLSRRRSLFQPRNPVGRLYHRGKQLLRVVEGKGIDHVDDDETGLGRIGNVAMKIGFG
jgi:hypothetical protein